MEPSYLNQIAYLLEYNRVVSQQQEVNESNLPIIIEAFQQQEGLYVDGIIGPETLWKLQYRWANDDEKQLMLVKCVADPIAGGYSNLVLREDAAKLYNIIREQVLQLGGKISTSGGLRQLNVAANAHQSALSMHYPGLAFDVNINDGFFKPEKDTFVIEKTADPNGPYWRVWCRADGGEQQEINAVYWNSWTSRTDLTKRIEGKFIDFTSLCRQNGFHPIGPRGAFLNGPNRAYLSAEWWHFQANDLLFRDISQFGTELMRINTYAEVSIKAVNSALWSNAKQIFGKVWR